jgi:hypothetical protein
MKQERNRYNLISNIGLSFKDIKNSKKIILKFCIFLLIISITIVPSLAVSPHENLNGIPENKTCVDCHTSHETTNIPSESSRISEANTLPVSRSNIIQSFAASNVVGNITLISSLGQNWYQQGIYGPSSSASLDQSWGWTFFDENPPGGFIVPSEKITQKNNIYALLLDDGNNSNLISGANVLANVTYWIYNGTDYASNVISVQLTEDINRRGSYNGIFSFYGGTKYNKYGMNNCDGCHPTAYHGFPGDNLAGYFPGNYTVSIKAEVDNKIKIIETNFEVTPWGCEDCHGSGNQHHYGSYIDSDSACYVCHGVTQIGYHSKYKAGNPHQNTAHREIQCTDCHTNKSINSQTFNGVTFVDEKPQYDSDVVQLNAGTHSNLTCIDCHRDLTLSVPQGDYKSDNYTINNIINRYDLSFTSIQQFQDNYVLNVTQGEPLNISFDWEGTSNLGFYLYPPDFNPRNLTGRPYNNGATNLKPETYINLTPIPGKWILSPYGYNLGTRSGMVPLFGTLQSPINYTISSTYPIEQKNLPLIPECNECHNSSTSGKAYTEYEIPDWNPGFAHVDTNGDGTLDIQCRMCHDAMHNIVIKTCQNCHTTAPTNHPISDPSFTGYTPAQCLACHGDPHRVTITGGTCIACHATLTGDNIYPAIDTASFGKHKNINKIDGDNNLTDIDCEGCHYNISNMMDRSLNVDTRICTDCHIAGNFSAPIINNHKPPKVPVSVGGKISTTAYCSICHNNSINKYIYSINASASHYGTNESLVKTVNQTPRPRFGFMNSSDAQQYNKECNNCHNPSNSSYGNATLIKVSHIGRGTCNECHINGSIISTLIGGQFVRILGSFIGGLMAGIGGFMFLITTLVITIEFIIGALLVIFLKKL